jgi:hypothetical protein
MSIESDQLLAELGRYANLIQCAIRPSGESQPFIPQAESAAAIQIERGLVLRDAVIGREVDASLVERLIFISSSVDELGSLAVVDRSDHHRPVYRPLLAYAWLKAFAIRYETLSREQFGRWDEALRVWADLLESALQNIAPGGSAIAAARGAGAAEAAWTALALHVAGKLFVRDAWSDLAGDTFGRLTRAQQPDGSFLAHSISEHPELAWYHELSILHAAASYAVQAEDRALASAVRRSTQYHLSEIQADHATTQPWGIFAFIWNPQTRSIADQMLHAIRLREPDAVSLILLADALYCVRLFL